MRLIDISKPLRCGREIACRIPEDLPVYEGRACEAYRFELESHTGCYYETAGHLFRGGTMTADVPVHRLFLPAVVARLDPGVAGVIEPAELLRSLPDGIRAGDALLVDTRGRTDRHFSRLCGAWMVGAGISLLAATLPKYDTGFENPTGVFTELFTAEIPIIGDVQNFDQITGKRVFLIVLPMPIERVCTAPCRAVVVDADADQIEALTGLLRPDLTEAKGN